MLNCRKVVINNVLVHTGRKGIKKKRTFLRPLRLYSRAGSELCRQPIARFCYLDNSISQKYTFVNTKIKKADAHGLNKFSNWRLCLLIVYSYF